MSVKYIELRARSAFSFLEGSALPEDLVERAAELGYPAIAMGDRDGLYGAPRFYHGAERAGIRAIVGAELTLDLSSYWSSWSSGPSSTNAPSGRAPCDQRLYVLVPDRERYRNLCRMITASKMRPLNPAEIEQGRVPRYPAKGESRITLDDLERYGAGLICLAGGARSPLALALT
ncbi:MAG TPA: PHP domain-containing protein, partial [Candidatus Binataceae bacterium]|nr:PHP domain-containing protein [Candidatus Binataceae bacterium]